MQTYCVFQLHVHFVPSRIDPILENPLGNDGVVLFGEGCPSFLGMCAREH